jgi:TolB-like protein/class 3 adenylate cyclase
VNTSKNYLAAIMFTDIVGYSALMEKSVTTAMGMVGRYEMICESIVEKHNGRIVKKFGDGGLFIFNSTVDAINCSEELQLKCREYPEIPLRIGLHSGEVIEKDNDVFGNAINIASRIESMAVSGGVLFSDSIYEQIKNVPGISSLSIGHVKFKNIEKPMEVFALTNQNFPIPIRPQLGQQDKSTQKGFKKLPILIIGLALSMLTAVLGFNYLKSNDKVHVVSLEEENDVVNRSIAILPFDNMSGSQDNQYFADGMHDDLLTFLSKSKDLKVISRTSVSKLKDSKQSIGEIANLLGVTHVMEGSVRRVGDNVRINVQLIDATTDNTLWADTYNEAVTTQNIFEIQSEIVTKISSTLMSSVFNNAGELQPSSYTSSLEAYEKFLRAKQLKESGDRESLYKAKELLDEALELDGEFAEAIVLLGNLHIHLVYYGGEDPDVYFPKSWDYMEKGMELKPELSDVHSLKGSLYHWWKREFEGAKQSYDKAIQLQPNNYSALYGLAIAYQDLNLDVKEINKLLQKALAINPLNPDLINLNGIYQRENNQTNQALQTFKKGIEIEPHHSNLWLNYAQTFYFKARIDSVAIISHQSILNNGKDGRNISTYLRALTNLSALPELEKELSSFIVDSRQDSITLLSFLRSYHLLNNEFELVNEKTDKLVKLKARRLDANSKYSSLIGDLSRFEDQYYKSNFEEAVKQYDKLFADVDPKDIINNYSQNDLNATIGYIHALRQTGNTERADVFIQLIKEKIANSTNINIRLLDKLYINYLNATLAIFENEYDKVAGYLSEFLKNGNLGSLVWIEIDPLFDALEGNEFFENLIRECEDEISTQQDVLRDYLANISSVG